MMNGKILMIDKDVNESRKLKINLENLGCRVLISKTIQEGILIANANEVDVIMIFDADTEIRLLEQERFSSDIPIMAVINLAKKDDIESIKEILDDYAFIPYDKEQVYQKIKNLIKIKELRNIIKQKDEELQSLYKKVEDTSLVDETTGLYNTFYLKHIIAKECVSSNRYGYRISGIVLDIDNQIEDGQKSSVLKEVAKIIKSGIRQDDTLVRLDSGEFYVFLPHTGIKDAVFVANKLKDMIESNIIIIGDKISVSAGVTSLDEIDRGFRKEDEMIRQTIEALKKAQSSGGSKIECY